MTIFNLFPVTIMTIVSTFWCLATGTLLSLGQSQPNQHSNMTPYIIFDSLHGNNNDYEFIIQGYIYNKHYIYNYDDFMTINVESIFKYNTDIYISYINIDNDEYRYQGTSQLILQPNMHSTSSPIIWKKDNYQQQLYGVMQLLIAIKLDPRETIGMQYNDNIVNTIKFTYTSSSFGNITGITEMSKAPSASLDQLSIQSTCLYHNWHDKCHNSTYHIVIDNLYDEYTNIRYRYIGATSLSSLSQSSGNTHYNDNNDSNGKPYPHNTCIINGQSTTVTVYYDYTISDYLIDIPYSFTPGMIYTISCENSIGILYNDVYSTDIQAIEMYGVTPVVGDMVFIASQRFNHTHTSYITIMMVLGTVMSVILIGCAYYNLKIRDDGRADSLPCDNPQHSQTLVGQ